MAQTPEQTVRRHLWSARRELRKAVERFATIDPLEGHRAEALRLAREAKAAADTAVEAMDGGTADD